MMEKILWRDEHWVRILALLFTIPFVLAIIYHLISLYPYQSRNDDVSSFILIILLGFLCFLFLKPSFTYITKNGIRVGNAVDDLYTTIRLNRPIFIPWNNIREIILLNKVVSRGAMGILVSFMVVKTKDGNKYWCFLPRKKGFVRILAELKKNHLIVIGKPNDLILQKEKRLMTFTAMDVARWQKFSFPWMGVSFLLGIILPKPFGISTLTFFPWLLITAGPPLLYLGKLSTFRKPARDSLRGRMDTYKN